MLKQFTLRLLLTQKSGPPRHRQATVRLKKDFRHISISNRPPLPPLDKEVQAYLAPTPLPCCSAQTKPPPDPAIKGHTILDEHHVSSVGSTALALHSTGQHRAYSRGYLIFRSGVLGRGRFDLI